jgi:hypothetical protein
LSLELTALAFFKEKKVQYYLDKPNIIFPCPHCLQEAKMNCSDTKWICNNCSSNGTLIHLIQKISDQNELASNITKVKIYNPTKEKHEINKMFKHLVDKHGSEIINIKNKVGTLINYLSKNQTDVEVK